jgi:hypothetical protein
MATFMDIHSGFVGVTAQQLKEAVMRIHERAGHPTAEVYAIPVEVA